MKSYINKMHRSNFYISAPATLEIAREDPHERDTGKLKHPSTPNTRPFLYLVTHPI